MQTPSNDTRWYALHVRPRFEKMVLRNLAARDLEGFLPFYRGLHQWSDRLKEVDVPLFPGYVFCRFNINDRLPVLIIPGVYGVVGMGKFPTPIDEGQMDDIRSAVASGLKCEPWPYSANGQVVRIDRGALRGLRGCVVTFRKKHRLIIAVNLLQRAVAIEIDESWLHPVVSEKDWEASVVG